MYAPHPLDTSYVSLGEDLLALCELLAENVHEVWAAGRLREGWRYSERRDDVRRETPCLVPYDELPEEEKEYDRATAMATIRTILALGYRIEKI